MGGGRGEKKEENKEKEEECLKACQMKTGRGKRGEKRIFRRLPLLAFAASGAILRMRKSEEEE